MDAVKEWAVMICAVAIGSAFFVFLIPDGKLRKPAEVGVVLVLLILVAAPLRNNSLPAFEDVVFDDSNDDFEPDIMALYSEYANDVISEEIDNILSSVCEKNFSSEISLYVQSDNEIVLQSVHIFIDKVDSGKTEEIKKQVGNLTGVVPEVVIMVGN